MRIVAVYALANSRGSMNGLIGAARERNEELLEESVFELFAYRNRIGVFSA